MKYLLIILALTTGSFQMKEQDRKKINKLFSHYGSKWSKGIEQIEKDYDVVISRTNREYSLEISSKLPPALKLSMHLGDDEKGNPTFTFDPGFTYPPTPELTKDELKAVDQILKTRKQIWMVTPGNQYLQVFDLSSGLHSFDKQRFEEVSRHKTGKPISYKHTLVTRKNGQFAVLYLKYSEWWDSVFCIWIDQDKKIIAGANWIDVPMGRGFLLSVEDFNFIDQALRKNGDFGVYGSVTEGLLALSKHFQIQLSDSNEGNWWLHITPFDGHGHFLGFSIDKATGSIGSPLAGH